MSGSLDRGILMTFGSGANGCLGHGDFNDISQVSISTFQLLLFRLCNSFRAGKEVRKSRGTPFQSQRCQFGQGGL